jgi:hypothetical protein
MGRSSSKRNEEEYRKVVFKRNKEEYRKVVFKEKPTGV